MPKLSARARRLAALLAGLGALVVALFTLRAQPQDERGYLRADATFYLLGAERLARHGTLRRDEPWPPSWYEPGRAWNRRVDAGWSNVALGGDGRSFYPKHPWLLPVLAAPFVALLGEPGAWLCNALLFALAAAAAARLASRVAPWPAAAAAALLVAATPHLAARSYDLSADLLGVALALPAIDAWLSRRPLAAGLLFGLAILGKPMNATLLAVPLAEALLTLRADPGLPRRWALAALGALPPLATLAAVNTAWFGAPWRTGYQRILVMTSGAPSVDPFDAFTVPWPAGLHAVTLGPEGLLRLAPLLLAVAALGLAALLGWRRPLALRLLAFAAVPLVSHATYRWFRGSFLDLSLWLTAVPLAALLGALVPRALSGWAPRAPPVALVLGLLVLVPLFPAALARRGPWRAAEHVAQARVLLETEACDFHNRVHDRWECAASDEGGRWASGRALGAVAIGGVPTTGLLALPTHPSGRARSIRWDHVPGAGELSLTLALADGARRAADVVVTAGDRRVPLRLEPGAAPLRFTLAPPEGAALQLDFGSAPGGAPLVAGIERRW